MTLVAVTEEYVPRSLAERYGLDPEVVDAVRDNSGVAPGAPDSVLEVLFVKCRSLGVSPLDKFIYCIPRKSNELNTKTGHYEPTIKWTLQGSIDLFRSIAEQSGDYAGQLDPEWTIDGTNWFNVWLFKEPPEAARVYVMRQGFAQPLGAIALRSAYEAEGPFWKGSKIPNQLAKCAEALALRKAYPRKLHGIYTFDEMAQAGRPTRLPKQPPPLPPTEDEATGLIVPQETDVKPESYHRKVERGALKKLQKEREVSDEDYRELLRAQFGSDRFPDARPTSVVLRLDELLLAKRSVAGYATVRDLAKEKNVTPEFMREFLVYKFGPDRFANWQTGEVVPEARVLKIDELEDLYRYLRDLE